MIKLYSGPMIVLLSAIAVPPLFSIALISFIAVLLYQTLKELRGHHGIR